jgi:hypothetical protein
MATRFFGVYYKNSPYQLWQFYVGCEIKAEAYNEARKFAVTHPITEVAVAIYPEGHDESMGKIVFAVHHTEDPKEVWKNQPFPPQFGHLVIGNDDVLRDVK